MLTPIIDVHAHLLPEAAWRIPHLDGVLEMTVHADGLHLGDFPIAVERAALADPLTLIADMDECGIDMRVVSPPPYAFPLAASEGAATEYCALVNDEIVRACAVAPERLIPFGIVPTRSVAGAITAIDGLAAAGIRGIAIAPVVDGRPIGEGIGRAVLEAAAGAGLPILVHPVQTARPELASHYLRNLIGNPYESAVAIASCALSGLLDEVPTLRILFVHCAGAAPMLIGRWDHGWEKRSDVGVRGVGAPSTVLRDRIYFDALAHHPGAARLAVEVLGEDFVVLGSDYPFDMGDADPVGSAQQAGLDPTDLSRNALRWLGAELALERAQSESGSA